MVFNPFYSPISFGSDIRTMSIIVKLFKALVEALLPFLLNRKAKEAEDSSQVGKDQRDNFADILEENGELEN